jgi:hypothetical protein
VLELDGLGLVHSRDPLSLDSTRATHQTPSCIGRETTVVVVAVEGRSVEKQWV